MESKQVRPKATENTEKSDSAFEQEGKGSTLAAPAFRLTTSGDSAPKPKSGDPIRDKFYEIIEQGRYEPVYFVNGARYLMTKFGWYNHDLMDLKLVSSLPDGNIAMTKGLLGPESIQCVAFKQELFSEDYTYIVRTLGHEYQHCLYHWGHEEATYNEDESEFKAYYWEIFGEGCPGHSLSENIFDSIENAARYFRKLPRDLKEKYQPQMDELKLKKAELEGK